MLSRLIKIVKALHGFESLPDYNKKTFFESIEKIEYMGLILPRTETSKGVMLSRIKRKS